MAHNGMHSGRQRGYRRFAYRTYLKKEEAVKPKTELHVGVRDEGKGVPKMDERDDRSSTRWIMDVCGDVESLELATTARERLRGMLFRDPDDVTRLLIPCHDIHTFGMRHPLDVAFISRNGRVLKVHRNVSNMRRIKHKGASLVAERFSRNGDWLKEGDVIRIGSNN